MMKLYCPLSSGGGEANAQWGSEPRQFIQNQKKLCVKVNVKGSCVQQPITTNQNSDFISKAFLTVWVYISFTCPLYSTTQLHIQNCIVSEVASNN